MTKTRETQNIVFHYGLAEWDLHPRDFPTVESVTDEYQSAQEAGEAFVFFSQEGEHVAVVPAPGVAAYATQANPSGQKRHEARDAVEGALDAMRANDPMSAPR